MKKPLSEAVAGELLLVHRDHRPPRLVTLEARTPAGYLRVSGEASLFNADGWQRGAKTSYGRLWLSVPSEQQVLEARRVETLERLASFDWKQLPLDVLQRVAALLPPSVEVGG